MSTDPELAAKHVEIPSHFVVEHEGVYVVCERTMILQRDGFTEDLITLYLDRAKLRAAPLPGWSGPGPCPPHMMALQTGRYTPQTGLYAAQTGAYAAQTGSVVININNTDNSDSNDPHKKG